MILRPLRKLLAQFTVCLLLALLVLAGMPGRAAALIESRVGDSFAEVLTVRLAAVPTCQYRIRHAASEFSERE